MFWKKARSKYKHVTSEDPDIQKYFQIMDKIQDDGYKGILGAIQDLGHKYVCNETKNGKTLEIGFGKGRQALFYKGLKDNYYPTEINKNYVNPEIWNKFKNATIADARNLPFENESFDQVVSIYNLEHIEDLDRVFKEVKRVLKPKGRFIVALPCEDGILWNVGREVTTRRIFSKKYSINYDKVIAFEHVHSLSEIKKELFKYFKLKSQTYFPFIVPNDNFNLIYCCIMVKNFN